MTRAEINAYRKKYRQRPEVVAREKEEWKRRHTKMRANPEVWEAFKKYCRDRKAKQDPGWAEQGMEVGDLLGQDRAMYWADKYTQPQKQKPRKPSKPKVHSDPAAKKAKHLAADLRLLGRVMASVRFRLKRESISKLTPEEKLARRRAQIRDVARRRRANGKDSAYHKKRMSENPCAKLVYLCRIRLNGALKAAKASKKIKSVHGCTVDEMRSHLESQFTEGMTWQNLGRGEGKWSIDHIRPCASFDLRDPAQQSQCFHFTNLRPAWYSDNSSKSSKWNGRQWYHSDHWINPITV